jgi:phosphoserine phosphatase
MNSNGGPPPIRGLLLDPRWSAPVRAGLEAMVVEHAGGTAAFDFDDTVMDGDVSIAVLDALDRQGAGGLRAAYEADCAHDVRFGYARLVETLIAGRTESEVRALTAAVVEGSLTAGTLRIRPGLMELIWALQRHHWSVWVVTASPAVIIAVAAQRVGVPANRVLGMWCAADDRGRFTAPTREPITYRQGKVDALIAATGTGATTFAAGDATTDLEMLSAARYALVVDRGNPLLREAAAERGWWIQGGL